MSRVAARADESTGSGKAAVAAIFVLATALALLMIVRARPGPEPFDPRSSAGNGASALVQLLERSGATVDIARNVPVPGPDVRLLVLADRLDDAQRTATLDYVRGGGVAIVADPASDLHAGPDVDGGSTAVFAGALPAERAPVAFESNVPVGTCTIAALADLRGLHVPDGVLFPVGPGEPRCFGVDGRSFVIVRPLGAGLVVGLGDNEPLVNRYLRRADNAGLAAALLAPAPGTTVTVLLGTGSAASVADVGEGDDTLVDLVPAWVWMGLVLGALAFMAFAVSRSVRVGKVLDEPLATPIAGSELVAATGNLMQRAGHAGRAGALLQAQLHRDLCAEYHVDLAAPLPELDAAIATRTSIAPGVVASVLAAPVIGDAQLLALSARLDHLRKDVLT